MDKESALRRLKALAKLVASDNQTEAETAARQMQALMKQFELDEHDIAATEVEEVSAKSGSSMEPPEWERRLSSIVGDAFGARVIFSPSIDKGKWLFVGVVPAGQIAAYSYEVLAHKHRSDRRRYVGEKLKRYRKASNKAKAADAYSVGWVDAVARILPDKDVLAATRQAIQRFIERQHGQLSKMKSRRQDIGDANARHAAAGHVDGAEARLHPGVGRGAAQKRIGHQGGSKHG